MLFQPGSVTQPESERKLDAIKDFFTVDNLKRFSVMQLIVQLISLRTQGNTLKKLAVIYGVPQKSFQVRLQMPLFRAPSGLGCIKASHKADAKEVTPELKHLLRTSGGQCS
ncbi:hypothetical protein [Escherichia coli]|uniref:hypothetical protein n=1 Tax=Escherichia coli TaxID=562 RepID=UPI000D5487FF|nr:hypothetical protein [Escherichia coli]AWF23742.1 putative structural lytic transglycosylase domain protein [Escherichia coli]